MARKNKKKALKILIPIVAVVTAAAIGVGAWLWFGKGKAEAVNVYSFQYFGMTEYWGDSQESYGPVSTDKIQTVFLSPTQTVTEVKVAQGDAVKKGDLLMTFDTTLTDIALERERLKVEKLKLDLEDARKRLTEIKNMKPMVVPSTPSEPEEEDLGVALTESYLISVRSEYDGTSQELAMICWLRSGTDINDALLDTLWQKAQEYREKNAQAPADPSEPTDPTDESIGENSGENSGETAEPTDPPVPSQPTQPDYDPTKLYVVFKVTENDMSLGQTQLWQGLAVTRDPASGQYSFRFYEAAGFPDHTLAVPETPEVDTPDIDFGSGYTASQIAQLRSEQEKTIRDLEFQVKMAEADYKIKQTEIADGNIYAQIDGTVVSLLTPEEALQTQQPMLKVSGGGGFYVTGSVSELEKDKLLPGQEVTINDWNTGMTYTGTVESIENFPAADGYWSGIGNPNTTYYPFTVFVGEEADLQAGSYVSVMYAASTAQTGIYLENPFLRTENGKTYVYIRGEDGTLEKRFVTTGKSLWGSYTQILEGLSAEDFLAFPYGKHVRDGAPTVESDPSALYES